MIKPTIGRIVWYYEYADQDQPLPGIVCYVHDDTKVNLAVFTGIGIQQAKHDVYLYQGEGEKPQSNFAEWMPYQKGQAAKTEQLEKDLNSNVRLL